MPVTAEKVRPGLYILRGVTHQSKERWQAEPCGGEIMAERDSENRGGIPEPEFRWECFCRKCHECDPNGWRTLAECIREAPGFWS